MPNRNLVFAGALVATIAAPLAGLAYLWRRPLPIIQGHLKLRGLRQPVEVIRDTWGVPHIYARNEDDLFFAQGFVHAQDRLWQMELNRRIATGRLSEIVGAATLDADRLMRVIGLGRAAENDYAHLAPGVQSILQAYARGVNAFIETNPRKLPLEFTILRIHPEPWRPQDSVAWGKMMSWGQGLNWDAELIRAAVMDKLGPERAARLLGTEPADATPLILNQTPIPGLERLITELRTSAKWLDLSAPVGMSNNWVVDGAKSVTGKPLLANDPHLPLQMPSLWYEAHLIAPTLQAAGVSLPGAPGIVIGHNAEIAWGVTNACCDVQDLYIEKFHPTDPTRYEYMGNWESAQVIREEIRVKGQAAPQTVDVTITRHGPVLDSGFLAAKVGAIPLTQTAPPASAEDAPGIYRLALKWQGYEASRLVEASVALHRARNWGEFQDALRAWDEPALSFVYADRAGNIGYQLAGRVPIRKHGVGATPVPGWTGEYEWTGWIPCEELPSAYNPAQHYMATANNRVVGKEYPHHLSLDTMNGFRAKRIVDLLNEKEKLSADDYARMQSDLLCEPARAFVRLLQASREPILEHPTLRGRGFSAREVCAQLEAWDLQLTADSVPGAVYEVTLYYLMQRLYRPWLGELTDTLIGVGFHSLLHPVSGAYVDRAYLIALRILENNETEWMRDEAGQSCAGVDLMANALNDALRYLESNVSFDLAKWQWGKLHRAGFNHALGVVKPLHLIFNRGPFPYGGDTSTVWQAAFIPKLPIPAEAVSTPSWRQILDLSDWDASRAVHPTGQSGHPASRHYDDLIPLWLAGKHHPMWWSRARVLENQQARLVLE